MPYPQLKLRDPIDDLDQVVYSLSFQNDSQLLAAGTGDGSIMMYNVASGRRLFKLVSNQIRPSPVTACCFKDKQSANEPQILISAEASGLVSYYDVSKGSSITQFQVYEDEDDDFTAFGQISSFVDGFEQPQTRKNAEIYTMRLSNDSSQLALAGKDGVIRIYDVGVKKPLYALKGGNGRTTAGHTNRVFGVAFHPTDHNVIYSAGWDQTLQVWDARVGNSVYSIHGVRVYGNAVDCKGNYMVVGNFDNEKQLQIFDIRNPLEPVLDHFITFEYEKPLKNINSAGITVDEKIQLINQINKQLIMDVEHPDDDDAPEKRVPEQDQLEEEQVPETTIEAVDDEPTMIYDCKFGKNSDTIVGAGSGGREVRVYRERKLVGRWVAPAAIYACAVSPDGRFGAVGGNGFGLQVFSTELFEESAK